MPTQTDVKIHEEVITKEFQTARTLLDEVNLDIFDDGIKQALTQLRANAIASISELEQGVRNNRPHYYYAPRTAMATHAFVKAVKNATTDQEITSAMATFEKAVNPFYVTNPDEYRNRKLIVDPVISAVFGFFMGVFAAALTHLALGPIILIGLCGALSFAIFQKISTLMGYGKDDREEIRGVIPTENVINNTNSFFGGLKRALAPPLPATHSRPSV